MKRSKLSMMDKIMLQIGRWLPKKPEERSNMMADYDEVKKGKYSGTNYCGQAIFSKRSYSCLTTLLKRI